MDTSTKEDITSSSAALKLLQTLVNNGDISQDVANDLRKKYEILHESVINTIENERALLSKAQELNESLLETQKEVENKANIVSDGQTELDDLKMKLEENIMEQQDLETNIDMTQMEKESVERTNKELEQEIIERRKKSQQLLQPILERLNNEIETLNDEISNTHNLYEKECKIRNEYQERINKCKDDLIELERTKLHKRQRLIRQKSEPERLEIQCQVLMRNVDSISKKVNDVKEKLLVSKDEMDFIGRDRKNVDNQRYGLAEQLMRLRDAIDKKERDIDEITRRVEHSKHKIEDMEELRMQLTIELNEKKFTLKRENDINTKLNRLYEDTKRKYELLRRKKENVKQLILPLKEEYDRSSKKMIDLNLELKRQNKLLIQLKEDIDIYIATYLNEEDKEQDIKNKLKIMKETIVTKESLIEENHKKERLLREKIRELTLEREYIIKQTTNISCDIHIIKQKYKVKEIYIMDLNKKSITVISNLKQCRKQYEIIKNSRNRYANLVQNTYQALSEMKEKIKIVENELEILRNENISKETALIEEKRILTAAQYTRDQLRFELNKSQNIYKDKKNLIERYEMDINKLELTIKTIDNEMKQIAEKYKIAVKDRNRTGLQLIDRNDELSILYEKKNVLQTVLKNGQQLIKEKDEIGRRLKLEVDNLRRSLQASKKKCPSDEQQRDVAKRYCQLETQLNQTRKLSKKLSIELQIPNPTTNPNRYRKINGIDPNLDQLQSNIAVLSSRLTNQKEQLLEKELILEEVNGLTEKLRLQAIEGHEITLLLAKKMNSLQYQVKKVTRCMMATVSELSMYQATSLKLENEKQNLEKLINHGQILLNDGNAPFEQAEIEWRNYQLKRQRMTQEINHYVNNGRGINHKDWTPSYTEIATETTTTAEPRPNAYVADDIGIPKPYGAHAPFKPTTLGSNLRHIKKPKPRQVII